MQPRTSFRWYTRARRIPLLIGVMSDGTRIPGGPLTLTQALGGIAVGYVMLRAAPLWAMYGAVWNIAVFVAVVTGSVWLLGRLHGNRRPLSGLVVSAAAFVSAPRWGRAAGRPVRLPPTRRLRHRVLVLATTARPPDPDDARRGAP